MRPANWIYIMYIQLWHWHDVNPRTYNSPRRIVAATQTRERIVVAAAAILATAEGISGFSLQAVADKAGVTRLTVYNQFGSRRTLLEAVFDDMAVRGGLAGIPGGMARSDPLARLVGVTAMFSCFLFFSWDALGPFPLPG